MHEAGGNFFSYATLAREQQGAVDIRDSPQYSFNLPHRRRSAENWPVNMIAMATLMHQMVNTLEEHLHLERFSQIIVRTGTN
jgi:hypothetical protein